MKLILLDCTVRQMLHAANAYMQDRSVRTDSSSYYEVDVESSRSRLGRKSFSVIGRY